MNLRSGESLNATVSIGEIARRMGLRPSAIRYYESEQLLEPTRRRSGRRVYNESVCERPAGRLHHRRDPPPVPRFSGRRKCRHPLARAALWQATGATRPEARAVENERDSRPARGLRLSRPRRLRRGRCRPFGSCERLGPIGRREAGHHVASDRFDRAADLGCRRAVVLDDET